MYGWVNIQAVLSSLARLHFGEAFEFQPGSNIHRAGHQVQRRPTAVGALERDERIRHIGRQILVKSCVEGGGKKCRNVEVSPK